MCRVPSSAVTAGGRRFPRRSITFPDVIKALEDRDHATFLAPGARRSILAHAPPTCRSSSLPGLLGPRRSSRCRLRDDARVLHPRPRRDRRARFRAGGEPASSSATRTTRPPGGSSPGTRMAPGDRRRRPPMAAGSSPTRIHGPLVLIPGTRQHPPTHLPPTPPRRNTLTATVRLEGVEPPRPQVRPRVILTSDGRPAALGGGWGSFASHGAREQPRGVVANIARVFRHRRGLAGTTSSPYPRRQAARLLAGLLRPPPAKRCATARPNGTYLGPGSTAPRWTLPDSPGALVIDRRAGHGSWNGAGLRHPAAPGRSVFNFATPQAHPGRDGRGGHRRRPQTTREAPPRAGWLRVGRLLECVGQEPGERDRSAGSPVIGVVGHAFARAVLARRSPVGGYPIQCSGSTSPEAEPGFHRCQHAAGGPRVSLEVRHPEAGQPDGLLAGARSARPTYRPARTGARGRRSQLPLTMAAGRP